MTLEDIIAGYRNTAEHNDRLHREMTAATWADPLLAAHRRHVEAGSLGFGDPAFHAMWRVLLEAAARKFGRLSALEIGVYKGQVISLWALLARSLRLDLEIFAVSPLTGNPAPRSRWLTRLLNRLSSRFREDATSGNFYETADYEAIVRRLFTDHGLDFDSVRLHRGFSTDPRILQALDGAAFHVVYVDGDHSYRGALHDFRTFAPKVVPGGWLVADDAGCDLPGTSFWKGHASVSQAANSLPALGFRNVLNVGHNRVFQRVM